MAKFSRWMLMLTIGLIAALATLLFVHIQPRKVNLHPPRNDRDGRDWCLRVYEETSNSSYPILRESQLKNLAKLTPLPSQVSSIQTLFQAPWGAMVVWDSTKDLIFKYDFQPQPASFTVGLVTTAIGKYTQFLKGFISSADKYFLVGERLTYIIFTDHVDEVQAMKSNRPKIIFREENAGWPHNTLMRYHFLNKHREALMKFDYLYVLDVDLAIEAEVAREVLGMRVGTIHPGYFTKPRSKFTYDGNPKSTAFINKTVEGVYYFIGALIGGCSKEVATMANIIDNNIRKDLEINYIAVWHDESHLNRYFLDHPPTKMLSPEYMAAPNHVRDLANFKNKIVPLEKNHAQVRSRD